MEPSTHHPEATTKHSTSALSNLETKPSPDAVLPAVRLRVGLFYTCLVDMMRPEIGFATVRLLEDAGCQVEVPVGQTCCGQPGFNAGELAITRDLALQWLQSFEMYDYVVVPSGSCAGMIRKHYPALFRHDPDLNIRIQRLSDRTWELSSFLVEVCGMQKPPGRFQGAITYHDACSGLRELGVQHQPRQLLQSMPGLELKEMQDSRACCGFGGTFAVKYGAISAAIADEKIAQIKQSGASCVVMGDLGCMLHLEGRLRRCGDQQTRVTHLAEVLAGDSQALASEPKLTRGED
jgi:L-lactate dehydrogenase complex protein LldE